MAAAFAVGALSALRWAGPPFSALDVAAGVLSEVGASAAVFMSVRASRWWSGPGAGPRTAAGLAGFALGGHGAYAASTSLFAALSSSRANFIPAVGWLLGAAAAGAGCRASYRWAARSPVVTRIGVVTSLLAGTTAAGGVAALSVAWSWASTGTAYDITNRVSPVSTVGQLAAAVGLSPRWSWLQVAVAGAVALIGVTLALRSPPQAGPRRVSIVPRPRWAAAPVVVAGAVVSALLAAVAAPVPHRVIDLNVGSGACGPSWEASASGSTTLELVNGGHGGEVVALVSDDGTEVDNDDATGDAVVDTVGAGTTQPVSVDLGTGTYTWVCTDEAGIGSRSADVSLGAATVATPVVAPIGLEDMHLPVVVYRAAVYAGLLRLRADTEALKSAVDHGDRAQAKASWLIAHLDYARLGAAYGTFGPFDAEINGRPQGLPEGVNDPRFQGFLRLEYGLWHRQPLPELKAVVAKLDVAVHGLIASFLKLPTPPTDLPLRAHEILENTLQFEITGETDMGSNTNLATAWADVQGTETVLSALSPLLTSRIPGQLPAIDAAVAKLATLLVSYRHLNGTWASLQALSTPQREQLDSVLSGTLELLSVIPGNLEIQGDDNDG